MGTSNRTIIAREGGVDMYAWIDISQTLSNTIAHWPGDEPFHFTVPITKKQTGSVNIGRITTSPHTGTHVDAPFHFDNNGKTIEEISIDTYIGTAKVIDVTDAEKVTAKLLENHDLSGVTRILLKTRKEILEEQFPEKFMTVDENVGPYLRSLGVQLLGTESPSVDHVTSKELPAHHSLGENGIHILENIVLTDVDPGMYDLIALPLKIKGADGSPVRAVIRKKSSLKE